MTKPITIKRLRLECPNFSWEAKKRGFNGYEYIGRHHTEPRKNVRVYLVSGLIGEDTFETRVMVETSIDTQTYAGWWLRNEIERGEEVG